MNGKSDQGGWLATHFSRACVPPRRKASSVTKASAAPSASLMSRSSMSSQTTLSSLLSARCCDAACASRPIGASTRTRRSSRSVCTVIRIFLHERLRVSNVCGRSCHYAAALRERRADFHAFRGKLTLANCIFVRAAALFHHRNCATNPPACFEVAQHDDSIAKVAEIDWCLHLSEQAMLSQNHDGQNTKLIQIGE